eukprot:Skav208627  [mRNA]  locus=scaffold248:712044:729299:- [translate_table: standard]
MFGLAPRLGIGWRGEKTAGDHVARPQQFHGYGDVISARKDDLISKWLGTRRKVLHSGLDPPESPVAASSSRSPREIQKRWLQLQQMLDAQQRNWEHQKRQRRERRRQKFATQRLPQHRVGTQEERAVPQRKAEVDFSLDKSNVFAPAACCGLRSALPPQPEFQEDAWQGTGPRVFPCAAQHHHGCHLEERQVSQAADKSRNFMNRPGNPWFKPKGTSDVVAFGNAYARSFGYSVFSRASVPGMAGGHPAPAVPVVAAASPA